MDKGLKKTALSFNFIGWAFLFIGSIEVAITSFNLFAVIETSVISLSIRELLAEVLLLVFIFVGFFRALYQKNKKNAVLNYTQFLMKALLVYFFIVCRFALVPSTIDSIAILLNGTLISEPSMFNSKIVVIFLGLLFFSIFYIDAVHNGFTAVELPFLLAMLLWIFLFSLYCFNFLLLFLLMEAITLLIVVSNTLYFTFIGPKLVKPIIQFFILNLMISTFYILGVALLVFMVPEQGAYTASYASIWNLFETMSASLLDLSMLVMYLKVALGLILVPLVFKLTLAPLSIWIVNVYARLPVLFILIIMTLYKIIYVLLFLRLFLNVIDLIPELQSFWQNSLFLFIVPSMFVGCLAYRLQDLKTILAYTTVSQLGYVMAGFIVSSPLAIKYSLIYLLVYCFQLVGVFVIFLILQAKYDFTNLNQLFIIKKYNKFYYYLLIIIFFSLSGVPPLSGFFIKYFLFLHIYNSGFFIVAILGVVSGFIMSIIYLQMTLQIMTVKESHVDLNVYEHNKKVSSLGAYSTFYNQIVFGLNCFLFGLLLFNAFFFFVLPELSYAVGEFVYIFIYAGCSLK